MEAKALVCEKCFKPMRVYEENSKNFEEYHIQIIKSRFYERIGSQKISLTFGECDCSDRKIIAVN